MKNNTLKPILYPGTHYVPSRTPLQRSLFSRQTLTQIKKGGIFLIHGGVWYWPTYFASSSASRWLGSLGLSAALPQSWAPSGLPHFLQNSGAAESLEGSAWQCQGFHHCHWANLQCQNGKLPQNFTEQGTCSAGTTWYSLTLKWLDAQAQSLFSLGLSLS